MKLARLEVTGLGTIEVSDLESYEVAESFMKFLRKRVMEPKTMEAHHKEPLSFLRTEDLNEEQITLMKKVSDATNKKKMPEHTLENMWSDEEKAYLFEHHQTETAEQIGKMLNRSINAVKSMGYKNGLTFRSKRRKGVPRGSYKKSSPASRPVTPEPQDYRSLKKRILESAPKLVVRKFLEDNPDVKEKTLTAVLGRMIANKDATQLSSNEVQIHVRA